MTLLYPIVEGHGEVRALPVLIRRVLNELFNHYDLEIGAPYRIPRSKIAQFGEDLEKAVRLGERKIRYGPGAGGVIILADADDDCPVELYAKFKDFRDSLDPSVPVGFVLANREYECWFIAHAEHLRTHKSIRDDALDHKDPETVRDAKGHFNRHIMNDDWV